KRIPLRVPGEPVHLDASAALDSAYDMREGGASLDLPLGATVAAHVDGSFRRTGDVAVPGFVLTRPLRRELLEEAAEDSDEAAELTEAAGQRGTLPNSATETWSLGGGLA